MFSTKKTNLYSYKVKINFVLVNLLYTLSWLLMLVTNEYLNPLCLPFVQLQNWYSNNCFKQTPVNV